MELLLAVTVVVVIMVVEVEVVVVRALYLVMLCRYGDRCGDSGGSTASYINDNNNIPVNKFHFFAAFHHLVRNQSPLFLLMWGNSSMADKLLCAR